MRIQHNIMAMNSYRNYTNNTSALSKNLEKLSSGYKINRAGDDAAGLAISEKMRAQITGLGKAQDNAKDGISLVQTAEGALTEVHDMLNRMYELANQSANGTYEGTDREQLQKEVQQLKDEINRIADSANFNGIKLLDGTLDASSLSSDFTTLATTDVNALAGAYKLAMGTDLRDALDAEGAKASVTLSFSNGQNFTFDVEHNGAGYNLSINRQKLDTVAATNAANLGNALGSAIAGALSDRLNGISVESDGAGTLTFNSNDAGSAGVKLTGATWTAVPTTGTPAGGQLRITVNQAPLDAMKAVDDGGITLYDGTNEAAAKFTFNGKDFIVANNASLTKGLTGVNVIIGDPANDQASIAAQLSRLSGVDVMWDADGDRYLFSGSDGGLTLQIGDTADSYNQLTVAIKDTHVNSLGLGAVDLSTQTGAADALKSIKDAINYVSDVRGTLGATQNRLDHTINNLSVMEENMQDAESTIRDTDVAEEMMAYTKNNILIQSAQAMLAQANQVPQGVLQLLQ